MKLLRGTLLVTSLLSLPLAAQSGSLSLLHAFAGGAADGDAPYAPLVLDVAGNLYGTTSLGGPANLGTVFRIRKDGSGFTLLHSFAGTTDGAHPYAGLALDTASGTLYGTASGGGSANRGTVFRLKTDGTGFLVLHAFGPSPDGDTPHAALFRDASGWLYGTTISGGSAANAGTVFRVRTSGTGYQVLHVFAGAPSDGADPEGALLRDAAGVLYGTTAIGGADDRGTIYRLQADGTGYGVLRSFTQDPADGAQPWAGSLAFDGGVTLYGTTFGGGANDVGTVFSMRTDGSGFAILHSFDEDADGYLPHASVLLAQGTTLWGTTFYGGPDVLGGTLFSLRTDGSAFAVTHLFGIASEGESPLAGPIRDATGALFGTLPSGGPAGRGAIFAITGATPAVLFRFLAE